MKNYRQKINWSELPIEILKFIANQLKNNPQDLRNFRSVCEKWRRATAISTLLPHNIGSEMLFSSSVYLLRSPPSTPPWIVTVAETTSGKLQFCHPLSGEVLFSASSESFNLRRFNPRRLNLDYHMADIKNGLSTSRILFCHEKVLLYCDDQCANDVDDCSLLVLFRGGQLGGSPPVKPEYRFGTELPWFDISYGSLDKFDDILCFNGVIYALDRLGKLYNINTTTQFAVLELAVAKPVVKPGCNNNGWRKRLVGSTSSRKLFMIRRSYGVIKVYELCKLDDKKLSNWVKVESFGDNDDDKVLFVSRFYSFFVSAVELPGFKDCIIFSNDAFRPYSSSSAVESRKEIQFFQLGEHNDGHFKPISSFPGFPMDIFSLPTWVLQAPTSPFPSDVESEPEEDEMMEPGPSSSKDDASLQEHVSEPSCAPKSGEQTADIHPTSEAPNFTSHPSGSDGKHKEAPLKVPCTDSAHVSTSNVASMEWEPTIKLFEDLDIRSDLLQILQNICIKHGNVVGESSVRSRDMLACALQSLAKMINILQNTTTRTLTDSIAKELDSIMFDLQCVGLKVGWLVPFVDRALAIQKSKPHIESIMAVDKEKAQADLEEREFLECSAKKKQELEEKRACLSVSLPFPEPINLDESLGEGLI